MSSNISKVGAGCCGYKQPSTYINPIILGEINNKPPIQVKTTITFGGQPRGSVIWITGSGVDNFVNVMKFAIKI